MNTQSIKAVLSTAAIAAAAFGPATDANAQGAAFPTKNMVMIVPYTPAGSADAMSRAIATRLGTALGRNIVVDNRPGASGMIGTEMVARPIRTATRCWATPLRTRPLPQFAPSCRLIRRVRSFRSA